jgi:hypothetical protein
MGDYRQERTRPRRRPGRGGELGSGGASPLPLVLPKPGPEPAAAEPATIGQGELEAKREKLARVETWLREHELAHEEWPRGMAVYVALEEEIRALERGPLHELSRPGDTYVGPPVIFPADTDVPMIAGKWERLPDGRIEARGLTLYELRVMALFRQLAREGRELAEAERQEEPQAGNE